ncbi:sensor histidine kinase [Polaribacter litorisediminis]|uniref:sensor histidine kinase n=1 Tax=Polaribacter litorisediminis TaxID=1908341 RepID=UPI001CBCD72A|nr:sensor histidine kinase [Polaribacter litorisediminis]UAM97608.1 sensor histidine kinase [Polaribacter litorisediminis]
MRTPYFILLFLTTFITSAQSLNSFSEKKNIPEPYNLKVERYIIENKLDSAAYYLDLKIEQGRYYDFYRNIINNKPVSYSEFYSFISGLGNRRSQSYDQISNFINRHVIEPTNTKNINLEYVEIKWTQISKLRDEVSLDKASVEQHKLEQYINKFSDSNKDVLRAKTKIKTHPIVMYLIQNDPKGKELCLEALETARKLNDKQLEIMFLYHLSDFLVNERKLDEYIAISEKGLELQEELAATSPYYHSTIEHLIDAYIFKGGHNERVISLIGILFNDPDTKKFTYVLYIKLIGKLQKDEFLKKKILNKFDAKDIPTLIENLEVLAKDLSPNDLNQFYKVSSNTLATYKFYDLALRYKDKNINNTKKIYSEDLSNSLANYKIQQVVKEKEKEIIFEKEKKDLYAIIAALAGIFLFFCFIIIMKIKRQSKDLSEKNNIIRKTLKEKEVLMTEVHHRVKNNFQIISSLLELQLEGIEDEQAINRIKQGKDRVKSMALIHQKLFRNESGLIDFNEYISLLIKEISFVYELKIKVATKIEVENIFLDVDTAIPLGLIINEAITNSFKYAFTSDKKNTLFIQISKEHAHNYKLIIEDNGSGISNDLDLAKTTSLGLKLIYRLVKQLHGSITQTNINGAKFVIYFKDEHARKMTH